MSYTQLKLDVADWMHRTDLDLKMDMFSVLAEAMIDEQLRCQENETTVATVFDNKLFPLPDDYLEARSVILSKGLNQPPIQQVALQQLERLNNTTGVVAYAIHSGNIEFNTDIDPTAPKTGELVYYSEVPPLSTIGIPDTNDVLDKYPLIYLSAMLFHTNSYVQDDEQSQKWLSIFTSQVAKVNKTTKKGRYVLPQVR